MPTNIHIVGTAGIPANYGGFETLAEQLSMKLTEVGDVEVTVYCSGWRRKAQSFSANRVRRIFFPISAHGARGLIYDLLSLIFSGLAGADVVLLLGAAPGIFLPLFRVLCPNVLVVVNIDGVEWRREKWGVGTKFFLKLAETLAAKYSDAVVADNVEISKLLLERLGIDSELIAYGGDHVSTSPKGELANELKDARALNGYDLFVGRAELENNLHIICAAYASKAHLHLLVVTNATTTPFGRRLLRDFSGFKNITFADPIFDVDKLSLIRKNARLFLHGHSAGGTNPALVEAMFFEKQIYCYDCAFNRETTENKALYWKSVEDIHALLEGGKNGTFDCGLSLLRIAHRRYRWEVIVEDYRRLLTNLGCRQ